MMHPVNLACVVLFGAIGLGFFVYGKRQQGLVPLLCGLGLMAFPYFVTSLPAVLIIGVVLTAIPWFVKR